MRRHVHKDVQAGVVVALIGVGFAARSAHYRIGTLLEMGPGYFPAALGIIFALVGNMVALGRSQLFDQVFDFIKIYDCLGHG